MTARARTDADRPHLAKLRRDRPLRPIFVMGLHRSGTTFFYQTLADLLPVASVTVYHVLRYSSLLADHFGGRSAAARKAVDELFSELGLATRQMDGVPLGHATVEEYGWILARRRGSMHLTKDTVKVFEIMCRKLLDTTEGAEAVLLKNPWDAGRGAEILRLLPGSRFLYLRRDPLGILSSQLRNAVHYGSGPDRFLGLLLRGIPLARCAIGAQRAVHEVLGASLYRRIMLELLMRDVAAQLRLLEDAVAELPADAATVVRYEDLTRDPRTTLERVVAFLGLTPRLPLELVKPRPRELALPPEVEAVRERFLAMLGVGSRT